MRKVWVSWAGSLYTGCVFSGRAGFSREDRSSRMRSLHMNFRDEGAGDRGKANVLSLLLLLLFLVRAAAGASSRPALRLELLEAGLADLRVARVSVRKPSHTSRQCRPHADVLTCSSSESSMFADVWKGVSQGCVFPRVAVWCVWSKGKRGAASLFCVPSFWRGQTWGAPLQIA